MSTSMIESSTLFRVGCRASAASASSSGGVPRAIITVPSGATRSAEGLGSSVVPGLRRTARSSAPVRSAIRMSPTVRSASSEPDPIRTCSIRQSRSSSCMTTSRNSATSGCRAKAAIRRPPISCGFTARVAPASSSLALESTVRARATMTTSGLQRPSRQRRVDRVRVGAPGRRSPGAGVLDPGLAQDCRRRWRRPTHVERPRRRRPAAPRRCRRPPPCARPPRR